MSGNTNEFGLGVLVFLWWGGYHSVVMWASILVFMGPFTIFCKHVSYLSIPPYTYMCWCISLSIANAKDFYFYFFTF